MQNYIEKKTGKSIFQIFFLRKTNQEPRKSIFTFLFLQNVPKIAYVIAC